MEQAFVMPDVEMGSDVEQLQLVEKLTVGLEELLRNQKRRVLGFGGSKLKC
jgi:hypothetical protein